MSLKVLVTGGAGYLGSILCEHLLDAGYKVTALDTLVFGQLPHFHLASDPNYNFIFGDARDERVLQPLLKEHDVLIPLAAVVGAPACDRDPWLARTLNLEAIKSLNKLRSPEQLVIFPTTNSGYGTKSGNVHCTEETALEPISLYGQTKVEAEALLLNSGNAVTLRLATVFGLSQRMRIDLLVNHFVYVAVTDGYIVIFEKDFKRNFVHVRDVADCFMTKKGEERFEVGEWQDEMDVPVLVNAQSSMICKTMDRHRFGTHTIFIGELVGAHHRDNAKPLTYYDRRYIDITAAPDHAIF